MARKLASAVALITMAISATALALGLGDIQTRSALNQKFEAEVELLSVDPTELDALKVRLASPEAFQRAGVDRPFYLSSLRFVPQVNAAGQSVIRVYSDKPIREPFLNFLLEVNWPKGKLLREYTVLLDPPTTLQRRASPVARPQTGSRPAAAPRTEQARRAPAGAVSMPNEYGPVQDNETLWSIARSLRPDGASLTQTLMALYKANPNAFVQGDINRLQKGRILRVPSRDDVLALSRRDADAAYRAAQDTALASRSQPPAEPSDQTTAQPDTAQGAGQGGGGASNDAELRIATPSPEGEGKAGAGDADATQPGTEKLENALLLARENAETSRQAAENLRGEVSALEEQLAEMQRMLSVRDEQLARLQVQTGAEPTPDAAQPATGEPATESAMTDTGEQSAAAPVTLEQPTDELGEAGGGNLGAAGGDVGPEAITEHPTGPDGVADTELPGGAAADGEPMDQAASPAADQPTGSVETPADAQATGPAVEIAPADETDQTAEPLDAATAEQPAASRGTDRGLLASLLAIPLLWIGLAVALLLLLIGLVLMARRRKQTPPPAPVPVVVPEQEDESILLEPDDSDDGLSLTPEDAAPAGNDTSFLSEFSPSDMHSLADETSEVDPVSEADVYIAYGRYDQAEELLNQALNRDPGRLALKFKLLEVYYANRNVAAFTATAQELADAGQDGVDAAAWQRVCDMGHDLAPDYPLFAGAATGAVGAGADELGDFAPSEPMGIDTLSGFDEDSTLHIPPAVEPESSEAESSDATGAEKPPRDTGGETELDLTLDLDDLSMPHSVSQDDETLEGLESIDLELPDLDMDPTKTKVESHVSDDSLILDLDTGLEDSVADSQLRDRDDDQNLDAESLQAQLEELSDLTELDDELSQLTADFDGLDMPDQGERQGDQAGRGGLDLDIPSPFADQMGDEDEVQTKLDLAIAYVEMGDKEGARSILDEVKAEGNDSQRAEADKLLNDLDA